jgi:hypothetical protein
MGAMPKPHNYGIPRMHHPRTPEQQAKAESRHEQGWQRRSPIVSRTAMFSRDGRAYERDQYGTVTKGQRQ